MKTYKRAVLYLSRKKGRAILMTALLFLMACCVLFGSFFWRSAGM